MTLLECARKNIKSVTLEKVARFEGVTNSFLAEKIKKGHAVIPLNKNHSIEKPCAIGSGLKTKINANIGTSTDSPDIKEELHKLDIAVKYGADAIMDLSVGGDLRAIRKEVIKRSPIPVGTVPVYQISVNAKKYNGGLLEFNHKDVLSALTEQAKEGVDFFTIHAGVNRKSLSSLKDNLRLMSIVSRGGAILASWIKKHGKENPFYEYFDEVLDIAREYDVTLSLGDGLRPGSIFDATDKPQLAELKILGQLAVRARNKGVQVMIEGPGHVPIDQIQKNILLQKKLCDNAPFYVLGPLVTDVAAGYDHITSAIGGAMAASFGADFLCYVTPAEHLRHPDAEDVREGVIASRIAAHAADITKGIKSALNWDKEMSLARRNRDWKRQIELAIDPDKAKAYRQASKPSDKEVCTMCGEYCSIKLIDEHV
ncbi:MAG: phosphomethylpyrimidine synthase ThiC [Candidatus Omnitrophota bacterium]|jgi:phosphomethylpyrimidine synthase|nr:MAG: phosphomethylpyrimidine synthase ThiC [Candidatus Omnitrophota bacterium]